MHRPSLLLLCAFFYHTCLAGTGTLVPTDLQCERLEEPLGIDAPQPRLSWRLQARSNHSRALRQSAFQVLVASSPEKLAANEGDLWDSGRINSDQCLFVGYGGRPLQSGQDCFWKVKVWDQVGSPSDWSRTAHWSLGLLQPGDWKAQWIGLDKAAPKNAANPLAGAQWIWSADAPSVSALPPGRRYFRRAFALPPDRVLKRAVLWMAGDNDYHCFLNGKKVGQGSYSDVKEMELTSLLQPGTNVLSAVANNLGETANPAGLLAALQLEFTQGEPMVLRTDGQWRVVAEAPDHWQDISFSDREWAQAREFGLNGIEPWKEISPHGADRLPARMLRREFTLAGPPKKARLYASGLGLSEFYLNGQKLGDQVLSPALSDYSKRVFYVTFDVTRQLRPGANCLGALLGNGRFFAPRLTGSQTYGFPKLLLLLQIEQADGQVVEVASDRSWRLTTEGPIQANNEYDGESYDARRELEDWARAGFNDAQWQPAQVVAAPGGTLSSPMLEPIRVTGHLQPVRLSEPTPGVYVFDMGQNMVGWCRLKVRGPRGTEVSLRHAETLRPDGNLYLENLRGAKVTDSYILKGSGTETWEPRFTYHGFRYVEVRGFPGKPTLETLVGCVVNDDLAPAGGFACSNPLLNRIYTNVLWGVRGNYRSLPTDCPQRDERQGWLGDRSAESKGEAFLFNNNALYAKWVQDMTDGQRDNGSISDVCPPYWPLYTDNVTWPCSLVLIPGALFEQFGDREVLARAYPAMARWMEHMSGFLTNNLMFRDQYGDWCVPPEDPQLIHSQDPARKTSPGVLGTAYFYHCLQLMTRYATLLNKTGDAAKWDQLSQQVKTAFNGRFYKPDCGYYDNGSQTSCILPLMFDLAPPAERARLFNHLVEKIAQESHNHVGTGLIGGQWLMRTLSDNGRADLAYTLAAQKSYPSWGYMVDKGATTLWELWNGDTADPAMNSHNHVMLAGDLVLWLYEDLAGIQSDPAAPGFHHVLMQPRAVGDLQWVGAEHRSPYGLIQSAWQREKNSFHWTVTLPPNTTATLTLPCASAKELLEAGHPADNAQGVFSLSETNGQVRATIGSGTYHFQMSLPPPAGPH